MRIGAATVIVVSCLAAACGRDDATGNPQDAAPLDATTPASTGDLASATQEAKEPQSAPSDPRTISEPPPVRAGLPSTIAMPPADTQTPPLAANAEVTYVCESGLPVVVTFQGARATVTLPDGREFMLTQAAGVEGGREEYRGRGATLVRAAHVVELSLHSEGSTMRCAESSATA